MIRRKPSGIRGQNQKPKEKSPRDSRDGLFTNNVPSDRQHPGYNETNYSTHERQGNNSVESERTNVKAKMHAEAKRDAKVEAKPEEKSRSMGVRNEEQAESNVNRTSFHPHNNRRSNYHNKMNMNGNIGRTDLHNVMTKGSQSPSHERNHYRKYYKHEFSRRENDIEEDIARTILRLHRTRFREFRESNGIFYQNKSRDHTKRTKQTPTVHPPEQVKKEVPLVNESSYNKEGSVENSQTHDTDPAVETYTQLKQHKVETTKQKPPVALINEQQDGGSGHEVVRQVESKTEKNEDIGESAGVSRKQEPGRSQFGDRRKKKYNGNRPPMEGEERSMNHNGRFRNRYNQRRDFKKDNTPTTAV